MQAGRAVASIVAPHISEGAHKKIHGGLSKYEQVRDQVRSKHDQAIGVAQDVRTKALPHLGI